MTSASTLGTPPCRRCRTGRPTPADLPAAIREIKAALRARIAASGRTVEEVFAVIEARVAARGRRDRGGEGARRDGLAGDRLRRHRGRHRQPPSSWPSSSAAAAWSCAATSTARAGRWPGTATSSTTSRATGSSRTTAARRRLLRQRRLQARDLPDLLVAAPRCRPARATGWPACRRSSTASGRSESDGVQWFDPDRDSLYPDRIRRRPPGADSGGLGTHLDPGTLDLWMTEAYQQAFRHLFDGTVEQYDPWDAAHRTAGPQYPGSTMCSAFRTFQGWTALSDMDHDQGVLHTVPIPEAMALPDAAPAARRRPRRRHVRRHRQPGLPGQREVAPAAAARPSPASPTSRPATRSGGTAT